LSRVTTTRAFAGLIAATALALAACGSSGGGGSDAKGWKSATDAGGVDKVCAAGKTEGTVNLIATPNDWANYGQMITDFGTKFGIKVNSVEPDDNSQQEIDAVNNLKGTGRQPDILDLGTIVAQANTKLYAPYKAATWADIPDANKEATGLWTNNYTGFESIAYDSKVGTITKVADLADPKYKGKVAINGDPTKASAAFNGVVLLSLANGGSADNIKPGVDFAKKLNDIGNLLPVDPDPGTIANGTTPIVVDWTYNQIGLISTLKPKGIDWKIVVPTDAPPVAAYYNEAINADAPHPAAARCWVEYVFSDAGQNTWLKGGALPVRLVAMQKANTVDQAAFAALNPSTTPPVQLTPAQTDTAKAYLTANWTFITIK
jgi:putative spermidine/putrescine transport system substrate-binding protein